MLLDFLYTSLGESQPFIRNVFCLNTCAHIVGSQVMEYQDETAMLNAWGAFVSEVDPDVIIGYNIANFDLPYLCDRGKAIKAHGLPLLSRIKGTHFVVQYTLSHV